MFRAPLFLAVALLLLTGCDGHSPTEQGPARPIPARFRLQGSATSAESDGATVSCTLDLIFELNDSPREAPGLLEYRGTYGGGMARTVLDAAGNGISLWPDVHGRVIARSLAPDQVQITFPDNVSSTSRFWRELAQLQGTLGTGDTATGSWSCAPFDFDSGGWVDDRYTARGTWTLTPAN
ncbi:MAG TPA: hypothetical protein VMW27_12335 [Thermoanaerobaculia bacterium]|nr:hypothetical protein [Thermoanaerobaculia bacterium]